MYLTNLDLHGKLKMYKLPVSELGFWGMAWPSLSLLDSCHKHANLDADLQTVRSTSTTSVDSKVPPGAPTTSGGGGALPTGLCGVTLMGMDGEGNLTGILTGHCSPQASLRAAAETEKDVMLGTLHS